MIRKTCYVRCLIISMFLFSCFDVFSTVSLTVNTGAGGIIFDDMTKSGSLSGCFNYINTRNAVDDYKITLTSGISPLYYNSPSYVNLFLPNSIEIDFLSGGVPASLEYSVSKGNFFIIKQGTVVMKNFVCNKVRVNLGGLGANGGGGGMGAGGLMFIDGADVTLSNVVAQNIDLRGGQGDLGFATNVGGGGGGLYGQCRQNKAQRSYP